jgi:bifunctional enzyme CysN/CysC
MVRALVGDGEFIEVFVGTPIEECVRRDPEGLYSRAKAGKIKNFTGIDAPYEPPQNPEVRLAAMGRTPEQLADEVVARINHID